jgi:hypothetical protein
VCRKDTASKGGSADERNSKDSWTRSSTVRCMRTHWPECSVHDLKAWFRSRKYVVETLKLLPEMPEPIFIDQAIAQIATLGRINHAVNAA